MMHGQQNVKFCSDILLCVLWSFSVPFSGPATIPFLFFNTRLKQWPHKQHHYHSMCSPVLTYEQNEILHSDFHIRTVLLHIIKVLFIQLMHKRVILKHNIKIYIKIDIKNVNFNIVFSDNSFVHQLVNK
jgi:hypothetical protein